MTKYKVKHTNIMHGENLYKEGSIIELTENEAKRLADFVDFVSETKKTEKTEPTNKQKSYKTNKTSTKAQTETKSETNEKETSTSVAEGSDGGNADGK